MALMDEGKDPAYGADPAGWPADPVREVREEMAEGMERRTDVSRWSDSPTPKEIAEADGGNVTTEDLLEADRLAEVESLKRQLREAREGSKSERSMHVPMPPSSWSLAQDLLRQAMGCHVQGMQNVIEVMSPADRDHILASLQRAQRTLAWKIAGG